MKNLFIITALLSFSLPAIADTNTPAGTVTSSAGKSLTWESKEISTTAQPGAKNETIIFKFTNTSDKDVTITNVQASCGCTTPSLSKYTYAPGESGEITAVFNIGNRQGLQVKQVTVSTDDGNAPEILTLKVDIPLLVKFSARALIWRKGEEPTPKTIVANVSHDEAIHLLDVANRDDTFKVTLNEVEPGKIYEIVAVPSATDKPIARTISVSSDYPSDFPQNYTFTLRVL